MRKKVKERADIKQGFWTQMPLSLASLILSVGFRTRKFWRENHPKWFAHMKIKNNSMFFIGAFELNAPEFAQERTFFRKHIGLLRDIWFANTHGPWLKRRWMSGRLALSTMTFVVLAASAGCESTTSSLRGDSLLEAFDETSDNRILVVAHRGCWSYAPENSISSIRACSALGVEAIEIDVQLSSDGVPFVFHDQTLERMTNGIGNFSDRNESELRQLRLKERDGMPTSLVSDAFLTDERIPTLEEFMSVSGREFMINLEIKRNDRWDYVDTFESARRVVEALGFEEFVFWKIPAPSRGAGAATTPADEVFRSLNTQGLTRLAPIVWAGGRPIETQLADYKKHRITTFEVVANTEAAWPKDEHGLIIGSDRYRYMGIAVLPKWSAGLSDELAMRDPDAAWGKLIDLGFDLIMTDRPEKLIQYLERRGVRQNE